MKELKLVVIDSNYCDYLRKYDNKVPYNFEKKENRPFVGVLFSVENFMYFAPLSSPKPKHLKMNNTVDFLRIDGGRLGAINFNNMIPVKAECIQLIDLKKVTNNIKENNYLKLLKKQIYWLNRNKDRVYSNSIKLYNGYINKTLNDKIQDRCCDFKLLENMCEIYLK